MKKSADKNSTGVGSSRVQDNFDEEDSSDEQRPGNIRGRSSVGDEGKKTTEKAAKCEQ